MNPPQESPTTQRGVIGPERVRPRLRWSLWGLQILVVDAALVCLWLVPLAHARPSRFWPVFIVTLVSLSLGLPLLLALQTRLLVQPGLFKEWAISVLLAVPFVGIFAWIFILNAIDWWRSKQWWTSNLLAMLLDIALMAFLVVPMSWRFLIPARCPECGWRAFINLTPARDPSGPPGHGSRGCMACGFRPSTWERNDP